MNEGFLQEIEKHAAGNARNIAKILGLLGGGAAAGAGGAYAVGESKRKKQLEQLSNLFRQANMAENRLLAQRAFRAGRASK